MSQDVVKICEMSPRDGMQVVNRDALLTVAHRLELIATLQDANLPYIEVGSLVNPMRVPAMASTIELLHSLSRRAGWRGQLAVLVPNIKYYQKCDDPKLFDTVALFLSAAEDYSKRNTGMTVEQAFEAARKVAAAAGSNGQRIRAHLSAAFRDLTSANLPTPAEDVLRCCERLVEMRCETIALADTDGNASAKDIERVITFLEKRLDLSKIGVHLHDRYGWGIANAFRSYQLGIRTFDAAVGGIGGNRAVKAGPVGNIATDELVSFFHGIGINTNVSEENLLRAGEIVLGLTNFVGDPQPPSRVIAEALQTSKISVRKLDTLLDVKRNIERIERKNVLKKIGSTEDRCVVPQDEYSFLTEADLQKYQDKVLAISTHTGRILASASSHEELCKIIAESNTPDEPWRLMDGPSSLGKLFLREAGKKATERLS